MGILRASVLAPVASAEGALTAPLDRPLRPLCPACGAEAIRISVAARVVFDVMHGGCDGDPDLQVVGHEWLEASWDDDTPCGCDTCGWGGSVADLSPRPSRERQPNRIRGSKKA